MYFNNNPIAQDPWIKFFLKIYPTFLLLIKYLQLYRAKQN